MSKTAAVAILVGLLTLFATPERTPAKGRTVKLIITSPNLPGPLEVTDQRILDLSHVWAGQFLDRSHPPEAQPRRGLVPYQLSFYVKFGDEEPPKMLYVAYYYPETSDKRGYIYLPGEREPWYYVNTGTMIRSGYDGAWSYASPAWEDLIKPVITQATDRFKSHLFH